MQMASEESKPYAYRVDTLGPGNSPRLLYRVYASDGHEELVRGAVFNELDVRALRNDLIAVGDDPLVSNRMGGVPETIICPSLLFDEAGSETRGHQQGEAPGISGAAAKEVKRERCPGRRFGGRDAHLPARKELTPLG